MALTRTDIDKCVSVIQHHCKNSSCFVRWHVLLQAGLTVHVAASVVALVHPTVTEQDKPFSVLHVIHPLTVVNLVKGTMVDQAVALSLTVLEVTDVDVAYCINLATLSCLAVGLPYALKDLAIKTNHLARSFSDELLMLTQVHVSVAVEQFAYRFVAALMEFTLIDDCFSIDEQQTWSVKLVILELTPVNVPVSHLHVSFEPHVVSPKALETRAISPGHDSETIAFSCFKASFISRFFKLRSLNSRKTPNKLQHAVTAGSTIFEVTLETISIVESDAPVPVEPAVLE